MAQSDHNFVVKNGLEVAGNTTLGGTLSYNNIALPASDGTAGQVIITDGSGALSFGSVTTNAFSAIAVNGQTTITTDQVGDTLSFIGGTGIALTTDAPSDALTITVDADTDEVTEGSTNLYHTAARAVTAIEGSTNLSINGGLIYADTSTAYVGIGDTSPQGKLDVAGNILVNGTEIVSSSGNIANSALTVGGSIEGPLSNVTMQYGSSYTGTPIQGSFWFDSLNQKTKVYTGSAWVDAVPAGSGGGGGGSATDANATFSKYTYNITSTTNAVSGSDANSNTLSYVIDDSQNVEVFVNGIKQVEGSANDYVATTGSAVTFTYNLTSGSVVDIQVYELLTADSFYLKTETYTQPEVNTQITTALGDYVPAAGGTFTGNVTGTEFNVGVDYAGKFNAKQTTVSAYGIVLEASANDRWLRMGHNGTAAQIDSTYNSTGGYSPLQLLTSGTARIHITTDGKVGIGQTSPLYPFALENNTTGLISRIYNTNADGQGVLIRAGSTSSATRVLQVASENDTKIMTVNSNGNVGIGTSSPDAKLHVKTTSNAVSEPIALFENDTGSGGDVSIRLEGGASGNPDEIYIEFSDKDDPTNSFIIGLDDDASKLFFGYGALGTSNGHTQMVLQSDGNVGIGTTAPASRLDVLSGTANTQVASFSGADAGGGLKILTASTTRNDDTVILKASDAFGEIAFTSDNTEVMRITKDDNVGIGTTNPVAKLHVEGDSYYGGAKWGTWTETMMTVNGGSQAVRIVEDWTGRWMLVGRWASNAAVSVTGIWSSVRGLSTSTSQSEATAFSADFGETYPTECRFLGATNFDNYYNTRTIDFIHGVPVGRPWELFMSGGVTSGMTSVQGVGSPKYGWTARGAYDGFGRWSNPNYQYHRISDEGNGGMIHSSNAFRSPTNNAFNWNIQSDAKVSVDGTGATYSGQDTDVTSMFGSDDAYDAKFGDSWPSRTSNSNFSGTQLSSAVWVLIKMGGI
jgi:hypothetical protein